MASTLLKTLPPLLIVLSVGAALPPLTDSRDVAAAVESQQGVGTPFVLEGTVAFISAPHRHQFILRTGTNDISLVQEEDVWKKTALHRGDRVRIFGRIGHRPHPPVRIDPRVYRTEVLWKGPPPPPRHVALADILSDPHPDSFIETQGRVRDSFRDEVDSGCHFLILQSGSTCVPVAYNVRPDDPVDKSLVGAVVSVSGALNASSGGRRKILGRYISIAGTCDIRILAPPPPNPFDVPLLLNESDLTPDNSFGTNQRKAAGRVIATWGSNILLKNDTKGLLTNIELQNQEKMPDCGSFIEAVGVPETDLYRLNLTHATWRPIPPRPFAADTPVSVSARDLLTDGRGNQMIDTDRHGQLLRLEGRITGFPSIPATPNLATLESDGLSLVADASSCPDAFRDVVPGCTVSVCGVFVVETKNWKPSEPFPRITGVRLVIRRSGDVRILSRAPQLPSIRLLLSFGTLLCLAFIGILIWNKSLRHVAEKRGQELADERLAVVESELKLHERTHLAVELHDSLSQTLSGVSMQIDAVGRFADTDRERMRKHLGIASKTLKSCRDELRNCLTDLRSNALEERDMNEAIRQTLEPYSEDAAISIRFFIPREILSDSTAHTILRIIRELVVNAIRHGHADKVKVAGALEDGKLLFSVTDNGCGFDTESVPGLAEGHFGLQGIRERVDGLDGDFEIESETGHGSKATVSIHLPEGLNEEKS